MREGESARPSTRAGTKALSVLGCESIGCIWVPQVCVHMCICVRSNTLCVCLRLRPHMQGASVRASGLGALCVSLRARRPVQRGLEEL